MGEAIGKFWLRRDDTALVVIDVQERLVPSMDRKVYQRVLGGIQTLNRGAGLLQRPVVVTEQYPRGLGATVGELREACAGGVLEKVSFGCCGEPAFLRRLEELGCRQLLVCGMEAHVCVYQTVLGLLEQGYGVHLVRDAICSRHKLDYLNALQLAAAAGAVVTTVETALFQLLRSSTVPEFKAVSQLVKERGAR